MHFLWTPLIKSWTNCECGPACFHPLPLSFAILSSPKVALFTFCSSWDRITLKQCLCPAVTDAKGVLRGCVCLCIRPKTLKKNSKDPVGFFLLLCSFVYMCLFPATNSEIRLCTCFDAFGRMILQLLWCIQKKIYSFAHHELVTLLL